MFGSSPETERLNSLPSVGVEAALREVMEEMEELLSARARGANGGGLHEWTGALKGQVWETIHMNTPKKNKKVMLWLKSRYFKYIKFVYKERGEFFFLPGLLRLVCLGEVWVARMAGVGAVVSNYLLIKACQDVQVMKALKKIIYV